MASPAFQFYPGDFITGTSHMTAEEVGGYIRLLCSQWEQGSVPDDTRRLRHMTGCTAAALAVIRKKFKKGDDGQLRNDRLEHVRGEKAAFLQQCSEAGKKSAAARAAKSKVGSTDLATDLPRSVQPTYQPECQPNPQPTPQPKVNSSVFDLQKDLQPAIAGASTHASEPPEPDPRRTAVFDLFERLLNVSGRASWNAGPVVTWLSTVECDPLPGGLDLALRCVRHAVESPQAKPTTAYGAVCYVRAIYESCRNHDREPGEIGAVDGTRKTDDNPSRIRSAKGKQRYAGLAKVCGPGDDTDPAAVGHAPSKS